MKGMLLEVRKNTSIVLGDDGHVYRIKKTPSDTVGKTIKVSAKKTRAVKRKRIVWSVATRFLTLSAVVLLFMMVWQFAQAASMEDLTRIDIESHSSLYFTVDQTYTVVAVSAKDESGQKILESYNFQGLSVEQALEEVLHSEGSQGIQSVVIAVTSSHAQSHIENLPVYQKLSSHSEGIYLFYIQPEQWDSYIRQDISPAKAALVQSFLSDDSVNSQIWASKSIRDIWENLSQFSSGQYSLSRNEL